MGNDEKIALIKALVSVKKLEKQLSNIKLIDGVDGVDGVDGHDGLDGKDGVDGLDGTNGTNGMNGINGMDGRDGKDGIDGVDGLDGVNGKDGNGIRKAEIKNDELILHFTNGTKTNVGRVVGENGKRSVYRGGVGTSAYEHAVEGGYNGTEKDFNTMLATLESGDGSAYILPTASTVVKGGIKVGENLKMTDELLSVDTTSSVEASDKPVTSAAVNRAVLSNLEIEALINSFA